MERRVQMDDARYAYLKDAVVWTLPDTQIIGTSNLAITSEFVYTWVPAFTHECPECAKRRAAEETAQHRAVESPKGRKIIIE